MDNETPKQQTASLATRWLKRILITLSVFVGMILLSVGFVCLMLTPRHLTPLINKTASKYLNATVSFDTVDFTLLKTFPHLTVYLKNGEIVSGALAKEEDSVLRSVPAEADTLLRFGELSVSLNLKRVLENKIFLRAITISDPYVYAYVAPNGRANWEIYEAEDDEKSTDETSFMFRIRQVTIDGYGKIIYHDGRDNTYTCIDSIRLSLSGRRNNRYELDFSSCTSLDYQAVEYGRNLPLSLRGAFTLDLNKPEALSLDQMQLQLADFPVLLDGNVAFNGDTISSVLSCRMSPWNVQELLTMVPSEVAPIAGMFRTNLTTDFDLTLKGYYHAAGNLFPAVKLDFKVNEGYLSYQDARTRLDRLRLDGTLRFNPDYPDSTGLELRDFRMEGAGINLSGSATVCDALRDPRIEGKLKGEVDLKKLTEIFPLPEGNIARGNVELDIKGNTRISTLNLNRIGENRLHARVNLENFRLILPQDSLFFMTRTARFMLGANENRGGRDSIIPVGEQIVYLNFRADTMRIRYKRELDVRMAGTRLSMRNVASAFSGDSTVIHPFTGTVEARYLEVNDLDSTWVKIGNANTRFNILPAPHDPSVPIIKLQVGSKRLAFKNVVHYYLLSDANVAFEATVNRRQRRPRNTARSNTSGVEGDSVSVIRRIANAQRGMTAGDSVALGSAPGIPKDSEVSFGSEEENQLVLASGVSSDTVFSPVVSGRNPNQSRLASTWSAPSRSGQADEFAFADVDLKVDDKIGNLLRKWNAKGKVTARSGRVVTPYFPLRNRLRDVNITFTTDRLDIEQTTIYSGQSHMKLTGSVDNIRQALLGRRNLAVDIELLSDTLNLNELIRAATAGMNFMEQEADQKVSRVDSLQLGVAGGDLEAIFDESQTGYEIETDSEQGKPMDLFIVPGNVDVDINLVVNHGIYADMTMDELSGRLTVRDRCLYLDHLDAITDIGDMKLTGLYATRSRQDITTGFDLEMSRMQVDKLIDLIPEVDTLLPMLRSFEGVVDCKLAATAAIDTLMNIQLPTLEAACRIYGDNMVLLDGETFTEIAKMMKFKNKDRNLIESISVQMLVRDNQIEIFPFAIEMDRYRAAVSGIQNLDMTFRYHISVLKSPIPFRLGVDITGNPDKFRFRLGRAKYKSLEVPSYVELIDSTRLNLRENINEIIQRGVEAATLSDLRVTPRRAFPNEMLLPSEALSKADSLILMQSGILEDSVLLQNEILEQTTLAPSGTDPETLSRNTRQNKRKNRRNEQPQTAIRPENEE